MILIGSGDAGDVSVSVEAKIGIPDICEVIVAFVGSLKVGIGIKEALREIEEPEAALGFSNRAATKSSPSWFEGSLVRHCWNWRARYWESECGCEFGCGVGVGG